MGAGRPLPVHCNLLNGCCYRSIDLILLGAGQWGAMFRVWEEEDGDIQI